VFDFVDYYCGGNFFFQKLIDYYNHSNTENTATENHKAVKYMADDTEYETDRLLADKETWLLFLETAVCDNPVGANTLARLLFTVKGAIERGPDDLERAINTLLDGIELTYLYTDEHRLALKLYMLYLTGHLKPQRLTGGK
jgi:hypothetical protein